MICIRNPSKLTQDGLEDILWQFGKPIIMPDSLKFHNSHMSNPYILDISNIDQQTGEVIPGHDAAEYWHSDNAFMGGIEARYNLTFFHSWIVPEEGGYTGFINSADAFEALPEHMKELCRKLKINFDLDDLPETPKGYDDKFEPSEHDLVFRHRHSGRELLYLGSPYAKIVWREDVPEEERD